MSVIARDSTPQDLLPAPHDVMAADQVPLLLTRVVPRDAVVLHYDRFSWTAHRDRHREREDRAPVGAGKRSLLLAALGGIGIGALVVAAFPGPRPAPATPLKTVIILPPPPVQVAAAPAPVHVAAAPVRAVAPVAMAAASVATPAATALPTLPETESAALAQAFSSNEAVSWRGAGAMGTVVVGAATIEKGRYCRDVAILTRPDSGADRTVNSRKCLEPGGRITDQPLATPQ